MLATSLMAKPRLVRSRSSRSLSTSDSEYSRYPPVERVGDTTSYRRSQARSSSGLTPVAVATVLMR